MSIKTFSIVFLIGTLAATDIYAQALKVSLSPEVLLPLRKKDPVGAAAILTAEWLLPAKQWGITLASGIASRITTNDYESTYSFYPVKAGLNYHILPMLYLNFNSGAALGFNNEKNHFLIGGGLAYQWAKHIETAVRYEDAGISYLAIRLGLIL